MFRKVALGLLAAGLAVSLATSEASARPMGGWHRGGWGWGPGVGIGLGLGLAGAAAYGAYGPYGYGGYGYYGGPYGAYAYDDGCIRARRVWTPYGWRIRRVNVCY